MEQLLHQICIQVAAQVHVLEAGGNTGLHLGSSTSPRTCHWWQCPLGFRGPESVAGHAPQLPGAWRLDGMVPQARSSPQARCLIPLLYFNHFQGLTWGFEQYLVGWLVSWNTNKQQFQKKQDLFHQIFIKLEERQVLNCKVTEMSTSTLAIEQRKCGKQGYYVKMLCSYQGGSRVQLYPPPFDSYFTQTLKPSAWTIQQHFYSGGAEGISWLYGSL